ncbi:hypothetical protein D3C81_2239010 [compost metagenome]
MTVFTTVLARSNIKYRVISAVGVPSIKLERIMSSSSCFPFSNSPDLMQLTSFCSFSKG